VAHIVLLGDSIFDNAAYVPGGPDVVRQLGDILPAGWSASLRAVDGSTVENIPGQLTKLPAGASHLVVSIGGNDGLGRIGVLEEPADSIARALTRMADIGDGFRRDYAAMLEAVLARGLPTVLCTIYEPRFPDPLLQRLAVTALSLFNDVITRAAFARGLPLIDLRLVCDENEDFANPIEPSVKGGAKIARAILQAMAAHDFARGRTEVFVNEGSVASPGRAG
jgi:hypothetical protein